MLALIPLLPFGGFLVNAFFGRRLPKSISGGLATALMAISFVISVMQVMTLAAFVPDFHDRNPAADQCSQSMGGRGRASR